ncbi:hypothetical protein N8Q62_17825 [Enterobacter hormaechei subsp. steigerwaltii]|nr:hypothetical protein [Enterobacter hormaechei subsp. steigerwaltii]MCU2519504.1 hypothetical protein [Enterobacter hormaechei subsp. steigerwaltii]MCU3253841.1 hypothetical protein [Enterobacter hormaechei subsp. steigerwaltii]MCU3586607.1 hypothetical protein [Enterobacter hormaechei subsp. steigerwaltii]MCU3797883.1 hypothetical protein [Enterobacter hormaechei subsp. steigerwaltii]
MITEKNNVFYCDCGFSFERGRSGAHDCADGLRNKLVKSEARCAALSAELSAVEAIHNEAVFITDEHYEQCPPEVQKIIRSLAVMQIPAYQAFLAEVRAQARNEGINYAASRLAAAFNHGFVDKPLTEVCDVVRMILDTKEELANSTLPAADGLSGEYAEKFLAEFAAQLRKGVQS